MEETGAYKKTKIDVWPKLRYEHKSPLAKGQ